MGGGGGGGSNGVGTGGSASAGGGAGGSSGNDQADGTANTGGGGGGCHSAGDGSGAGGSGVIYLSWPTADATIGSFTGSSSNGTNGTDTWIKITSTGDLTLSAAGGFAPRSISGYANSGSFMIY